jgi:hypothetical protein
MDLLHQSIGFLASNVCISQGGDCHDLSKANIVSKVILLYL